MAWLHEYELSAQVPFGHDCVRSAAASAPESGRSIVECHSSVGGYDEAIMQKAVSVVRDARIELWRCFCMAAIVAFHVLAANGITDQALWRWHVPGFLIITGYFGTRFTFKKVLKLLGVVYACYWLTIPLRGFNENVISLALPHGGWFLPFYVVLLLCTPIMNAALMDCKSHKAFVVSLTALLVIAWIPCFSQNPHVLSLKGAGLTTGGLLLTFSVYMFSRIVREYDVPTRFSWMIWALGFVIGVICMGLIGMHFPLAVAYGTPITLVTAMCGFCAFRQLPLLPNWLSRIILFVSPSMFSVYIIHHCCLLSWERVEDGRIGYVMLRAVVLFLLGLGIDLVRRGMLFGTRLVLRKGRRE